MEESPGLEVRRQDDALVVVVVGCWIIDEADDLDQRLRALEPNGVRSLRFDLSRLEMLDTAGAWLLISTRERFASAGTEVHMDAVGRDHQTLLEHIEQQRESARAEIQPAGPGGNLLVRAIAGLGDLVARFGAEARDLIAFIGLVLERAWRVIRRQEPFETEDFFEHVQRAWLEALPIVGALSFLIGVMVIFQGAKQLEKFGAQIYAVQMIGTAVLQEAGVLLPAIIVAGRSGSAYTAQIGAMSVRQEIDAMRAVGIDPIVLLVLPRTLALIASFPLLAFFGDMMGLAGGIGMGWLRLGITPDLFLTNLKLMTGVSEFAIGMIKTPVFAAIIALVGCFQGFRVRGDAEDVGRQTTRAVVQSIFLVIFADVLFAIFFQLVGL